MMETNLTNMNMITFTFTSLYLFQSLADHWGTTGDFTTNFLHNEHDITIQIHMLTDMAFYAAFYVYYAVVNMMHAVGVLLQGQSSQLGAPAFLNVYRDKPEIFIFPRLPSQSV